MLFHTLSCISSTGVSRVCASEHPECVCAERGARRQTASSRPGAVPSGGGAGSGWQGALEGPGDGGGHAGKDRNAGRLHESESLIITPSPLIPLSVQSSVMCRFLSATAHLCSASRWWFWGLEASSCSQTQVCSVNLPRCDSNGAFFNGVCVFLRRVRPGELTDTRSGGEDEAQLCGERGKRPVFQPQDDLQIALAAPRWGLSEVWTAAAKWHPLRWKMLLCCFIKYF